jgi:hypothetical protein
VKVVRTVSEADLARLKQARHEADRRYNEALTALDVAADENLRRAASLTHGQFLGVGSSPIAAR